MKVAVAPGQLIRNAEVARRVFLQIAAEWKLNQATVDALLGSETSGIEGRLSYLLRIYGALEQLLPDPVQARQWLTAPNAAPTFGGRSAFDRLSLGQLSDLAAVADYLEAALSGDFL